jgi:hypothetical protein
MKKKLTLLSVLFSGLPFVAFAADNCTTGDLTSVLCKIGNLLNAVIPVLIVLGVIYFIWGVITYVISSDEEAKKAGRNRIIFGIIGLAVIVAMWGLVNLLTHTFGLDTPSTVTFPTVIIH